MWLGAYGVGAFSADRSFVRGRLGRWWTPLLKQKTISECKNLICIRQSPGWEKHKKMLVIVLGFWCRSHLHATTSLEVDLQSFKHVRVYLPLVPYIKYINTTISHKSRPKNTRIIMLFIGQIFFQGFRLICIRKSPIFTPEPPRIAPFLCVMVFIQTHFLNSRNLTQKIRCQPQSNPFFGHLYVDCRL